MKTKDKTAKVKTKKAKKADNLPIEYQYELTFKINGQQIEAFGNTLEEAFGKLSPIGKFATKGVLIIKSGDKEVTRLLNIPQMRRVFGIGGSTTQKIARECTLKFIHLMLGDKINA